MEVAPQSSHRLAKARLESLQEAADLRSSPRMTGALLFHNLPRRPCSVESALSSVLSAGEQRFWHAFLANADVFASIDGNTGPRYAGQKTGMGWADICFATADSIFDLLLKPSSESAELILYEGAAADIKRHAAAWSTLLDALYDREAVLLFELDGPMEGHKFVAYPTGNKQVVVAQSVGGIMRANVRLFKATDLFRLLVNLVRKAEAAPLFGYSIDGNEPQRLSVQIGQRVERVDAGLLLQKLARLDDTDRQRMRATFADHFDWQKFDPAAPVGTYFRMDAKRTQWPFYYVDPVTFEWQCVDRAVQVPQSEVSIALQSGAVCPRQK